MRSFLFALLVAPTVALSSPMTDDVLTNHVLPRYDALAASAITLTETAATTCDATAPVLRDAYFTAFDAWIAVSHMRFGPSEADNRAFALAYWPDTRGVTPRSLSQMIANSDEAAFDIDAFDDVSIAARGYYAMEFLMFDHQISTMGTPEYRCALLQTVAQDIANTAAEINTDWQTYADLMRNPTATGVYRDDLDVTQEFYKAITTGLEFTANTRLGRPLGTFDKPRPARAEARRSERSARHVDITLGALRDLTMRLAADHPKTAAVLDADYARALSRLADIDDPTFAGVASPMTRFRIEALYQTVVQIDTQTATYLGPALGVSAGFNALDGD